MCENCYYQQWHDKDPIQNAKVNTAIKLIDLLYDTEGGAAGGLGHIVFDDANTDDDDIDYCLNNISEYEKFPECLEISIVCLNYFKTLTKHERDSALYLMNKL